LTKEIKPDVYLKKFFEVQTDMISAII